MATTLLKVIFGIVIGLILVWVLFGIIKDVYNSFFGSSGCKEAAGMLKEMDDVVQNVASEKIDKPQFLFAIEGKCALVGFSRNKDSIVPKPLECGSDSCLCLCKGSTKERCDVYDSCYTIAVDTLEGDAEVQNLENQVYYKNTDGPMTIWILKSDTTLYFTLRDIEPVVKSQIEPKEIDEITKSRIEQYSQSIEKAANDAGFDPLLLKAVVTQESHGDPMLISDAEGLTQLTPDAARECGLQVPQYENPCDKSHPENCNTLLDERFQAEKNLVGGACYLGKLIKKYEGNVQFALAAYNAGGNPKWNCEVSTPQPERCPIEKYGIPPFEQTQEYVQIVLGYMETYQNLA